MTRKKATCIGLLSILLWSSLVGSIRSVTLGLGPVCGAAMIYTVGAALLCVTMGLPKLSAFPRRYLYIGGLLFAVYEICYSLALGYADDTRQTLEVGMVNYLWPSLTILFAILFNHQKSNLMIIPGMAISILGICWVLGGEDGLNVGQIVLNIRKNPVSYILAFCGAFFWAVYCTITTRIAEGQNGVVLFFIFTALLLWIKFFASEDHSIKLDLHIAMYLVMAAAALGFGYAAWNTGILHGNVSVLATASYFTPILSSVWTAQMLNAPLSMAFWQGTVMVCLGSLLCWISVRTKSAKLPSLQKRQKQR